MTRREVSLKSLLARRMVKKRTVRRAVAKLNAVHDAKKEKIAGSN